MKNPYLFGYLPFITILLFSMTFGIFAVNESMTLFKSIGVYSGMREFLSEFELRIFLFIGFALVFFMVFSALKLIGETIHEVGMLLFSKDKEGTTMNKARSGYFVLFFGALASAAGISSIYIIGGIFLVTIIVYFIFVMVKLSDFMTMGSLLGLLIFEFIVWITLLLGIAYAVLKLYNSFLSSLPFH